MLPNDREKLAVVMPRDDWMEGTGPTQTDRDNAPLSPFETPESFYPMQLFFEEDYPSQRFRPREHEEKTASERPDEEQQSDVYGPYYSPQRFHPQEHEEKTASDLGLHSSSKSTKPRKVPMDIWEAMQSGALGFNIEPDGKIAFRDAYMRTPAMKNYQAAQGMPVAPHDTQQPQQPQ